MLQATVRTWRSSLRKETIPTCHEENPKAKKKRKREKVSGKPQKQAGADSRMPTDYGGQKEKE